MVFDKRIIIVSGHFGSGKTNIAVNIALERAKKGKVCIADLDIVNPYFRTADNIAELAKSGVRCIIPEYANSNVDIPSLPAEYHSMFYSDETCIIDVGGDAEGATVLSIDKELYDSVGYDMIYVVNFLRPMTMCADDALAMLRHIEDSSRLKFTHIINNTNLGDETTDEIIRPYIAETQKLSSLSGLPLIANTSFNSGIDLTVIKSVTKKLF